LPNAALPLHRTTVGVFSLTILSNTVVAGIAYPAVMAVRNAVGGHLAKAMVIGKPVDATDVTEEYGSLMETPEGFTRRGLDLDALRMYLRWRGATLAELRADPDRYRDPASLPERPNPPGDGAIGDGVAGADESGAERDAESESVSGRGTESESGRGTESENRASIEPDSDDEWGAQAFLDDIEGDAYGTTPETLRGGLEVLTSEDEVWMTPGTPFLVPMFAGLLVSLVYGDVLVQLISAVT
ncbi:MAG: A24 family peptidase C-terminal domain-containing protein, partial [Haloarculaceae archaeon]